MPQFIAKNVTYNVKNVKNLTFFFSKSQPTINWKYRTKEVKIYIVECWSFSHNLSTFYIPVFLSMRS